MEKENYMKANIHLLPTICIGIRVYIRCMHTIKIVTISKGKIKTAFKT